MSEVAEIRTKLWKSLKSDRSFMPGLAGVDDALAQPMTAQLEEVERRPIWIFTSKDTDLARAVGATHDALAYFAAKGHDLFASIEGALTPDNDPATACGAPLSRPGSRAARPIPSYSFCGSIRATPRSGSTRTACSRASNSCSAPIPRTRTPTRRRRFG